MTYHWPEDGKMYVFFDRYSNPLGLGLVKGKLIEEIPSSCGCRFIDMNLVAMWHEIIKPFPGLIKDVIE